jgi:tetratricopeptide (TPR) repeat protein
MAFSDDGRILAVLRTMTEIVLVDPRDVRELARLQSREPMLLSTLRFSPDGGLLLAGTSAGYFHVWDLRQMRARLKEMQLDWDPPPIGPPAGASATKQPVEVELQLDLDALVERANYLLEIQDYRRALADFEEALAREPNRPDVRRGLVAILTNGPMALRDLDRASELVRMAQSRGTSSLTSRGDLGMILCRQGRYAEAVASLEPAIAGHPDALDRARWRIFLAMSQHHRGRSRAAQESYDRARSDLADAKTSPSAAEEYARRESPGTRHGSAAKTSPSVAEEVARLWAEADATLHVGCGTP